MALPTQLLLCLHHLFIGQSSAKRERRNESAHENNEKEDQKILPHPSFLLLLRMLVQILPLQRMAFDHLFCLDLSVEDRFVQGEDARAKVGVIEMDNEDKPNGQQGLVAVDGVSNIEDNPRQKMGKEFREPEQEA